MPGRDGDRHAPAVPPLPEKLAFLTEARCNPDLSDPEQQKIGRIRSDHADGAWKKEEVPAAKKGRLVCLRRIARTFFYSYFMQTIVLLVIIMDCVLTIISLTPAHESAGQIQGVYDWIVIVVLGLDVFGRFFVEGWVFLSGKLNVFELLLVPFTIVEVVALKDSDLPLPLLRVLRPLFRSMRLVRVTIRALEKMNQYQRILRRKLSGERVRFEQDGFDLDLAYVTPQIVAMSMPAVGRFAWLYNNERDVCRFFNERHGNKYLVVNCAREVRYPTEGFFHRCLSFPIGKDSVPSLSALFELCELLDNFLKADPEHVIAVQSRFAQGRVALVVIALLLYRGVYKSPSSAIPFLEQVRLSPNKRGMVTTQTIDCASQRRFLEYFAHVCRAHLHGRQMACRQVKLRNVRIYGLSLPQTVDLHCYSQEGTRIEMLQSNADCSSSLSTGEEASLHFSAWDVIEQSTFDSVLAGSQAMNAPPILSSCESSNEEANLLLRAPKISDAGRGCWDAVGEPITGEFRLEIHRKSRAGRLLTRECSFDTQDPESQRAKDKERSLLSRCWGMLRRRQEAPEEPTNVFDGGLLVATWLHTTYLEQDEGARELVARRLLAQNMVRVELDRFSLDKGANAPPLSTHSPALRLELDFDVEERREVVTLLDADINRGYKISCSIYRSEPCSMAWLTWVMEKIWPSFESGFRSMFERTVVGLQDSLPAPINQVSLAAFSLGAASPKFGPGTASSRNIDGMEVQLDIEMTYEAETDIVVDVGVTTFGIKGLSIQGVVSVKFRPILPELPVLASMQLLFMNPPKIEISFCRSLEIANAAIVKSKIYEAIDTSLGDLMVLPNVVTINWADPDNLNDSAISFDSLMPCAVVRIGVVEGRNFAASMHVSGGPRLVAKVSFGGQTAETGVANSSDIAVWNSEFDFLVHDERQHVSISVYGLGLTGQSCIGHSDPVSVATVASAGSQGLKVKVQGSPESAPSEVLLRANLFDLHADPKMIDDVMIDNDSDDELDVDAAVAQYPDLMCSSKSCSEAWNMNGAVALLVCIVHGGRTSPAAKGLPRAEELKIEVRYGQVHCAQSCVAAAEADPGPVNEKTKQVIERLASKSVDAQVIADALGEDVAEVTRIIRKHGLNISCPRKICSCLRRGDLVISRDLNINLLVTRTGRRIASCKLPLSAVLHTVNARYHGVLQCSDEEGTLVVDLEMEVRLYALASQSQGNDGVI